MLRLDNPGVLMFISKYRKAALHGQLFYCFFVIVISGL